MKHQVSATSGESGGPTRSGLALENRSRHRFGGYCIRHPDFTTEDESDKNV